MFELAAIDKDISPLILLFTGRSASRDGKILVTPSSWVLFLAQMKRQGGGNHFSTTTTKEGGFHYSKGSGDDTSPEICKKEGS